MALYWNIIEIEFSGGDRVTLPPGSILIIVGPNNSGKSSTLHDFLKTRTNYRVLKSFRDELNNPANELAEWFSQHLPKRFKDGLDKYFSFSSPISPHSKSPLFESCHIPEINIKSITGINDSARPSPDYRPILWQLTRTIERLQICDPPGDHNYMSNMDQHPIHTLLRDEQLFKKVKSYVSQAFGETITPNLMMRGQCKIHYGREVELLQGEDRVSPAYLSRLLKVPGLHEQGDGVRSFVGLLLIFLSKPAFIHLIDEPEAFLHPSHARMISRILAAEKKDWQQLIVATHSGDVIRGFLEKGHEKLSIIRLTRYQGKNYVSQLSADQLSNLWTDPILRFSNVLDGLFHEAVVVCEDDSDCRFYSSVLNSLLELDSGKEPDVMFTGTGGKDRIPNVAKALKSLGVITVAICDFDLLREQVGVKKVVEALGEEWGTFERDWKIVHSAIEQMKATLDCPIAVERIRSKLVEIEHKGRFESPDRTVIKEAMNETSPWQNAKRSGKSAVPSGEASQAIESLLRRLKSIGLFVVPVGEVERFVPSVGNHGSMWVAEVLKLNIATAPDLGIARSFVQEIRDYIKEQIKLNGLKHQVISDGKGMSEDHPYH